jgi:hypothetical protein
MRRFYDVIENAQPVQVDNANQLSLYIEGKPDWLDKGLKGLRI